MPTGFPDYQAFEIPVGVPSGGTGAGSWTLNGVLYGRGVNTLGVTSAGAAYEPLRVPAAGGAPAFGALDLSQSAAHTASGAITFAAGGVDQNISLVPAGQAGVIVGAAAGVGWVWVRGAAATERLLHFQTGTSNRWLIGAGSTAETGSDAGSNFFLVRHNDAGARVDTVIFIRRSDGQVGINTISPGARLDVVGNVRCTGALVSTIATGTAPIQVASTTEVANLNADRIGGTELTDVAASGEIPIGTGAGTAAWGPWETAGPTLDGARAYNGTNQAVASAVDTALTFDSELYDNGPMHSTVTNTSRLTAQKAGKYIITGHATWGANVEGHRILSIRVGGTLMIAHSETDADVTLTYHLSVATLYHLAVGDYVELVAYQNSGVSLNVLALGNYSPDFAAQWLGR